MTAHVVFELAAAVVVAAVLLCLPADAGAAMTAPWWAYVLLIVFGFVLVAVFIWTLCKIAGETDRQLEQEEEARNE